MEKKNGLRYTPHAIDILEGFHTVDIHQHVICLTATVACSGSDLRDARSRLVSFALLKISALMKDSIVDSFTGSGTRGAASISLSICREEETRKTCTSLTGDIYIGEIRSESKADDEMKLTGCRYRTYVRTKTFF